MTALSRFRSLAIGLAVAALATSLVSVAQAQEAPSPEPVASPGVEASPGVGASPVPSEAPLEARPEGTWDVLAFDPWTEGLVEPREGTTLTAAFLPDGRLEGETGCGVYFGAYYLDGSRIDLRVISKGPDPCGPRRTEEAVAYSVAVDAATSWRPTETGLELLDETGAIRVILGRTDDVEGVSGDWVVERFARPNGKLVEPLPGSPASISLAADGRVSGSTGCRLIEGGYESESDRIVIAPIETVGLPCEGDLRRQERRLLLAIDEVVFWAREAEGLVLSDGSGGPRLVLRPTPPVSEPPLEEGE